MNTLLVEKESLEKEKPNTKPANPMVEFQKPSYKSDEKEKPKTYLYSVYPDGKGPDAELISSLEKEIVQKNLSITFDDIAELDDV